MSAGENVLKLAKEWQPGTLANELKYRDSLAALLRDRLRDAKVETEYRHAGTTIDIYVKQPGFLGSTEVFVEMKRNLLQKPQLDRLVGQIESLRRSESPIILVLCGETKPAFVGRLKEKYKNVAVYSASSAPESFQVYASRLSVVVKDG